MLDRANVTQPVERSDSAACFRELMSTVNLIAVIINQAKEITYCNEYFLNLTGWTFAELEGRVWDEVCVPPVIEDLSGLFTDLFKDVTAARHHENDVLTKAGERRSIRWNNIVLRDSSGAIVGAAGIGEDVTERKVLERELLDKSTRERRQLQTELHDGLGQELFGIAILARSLATIAQRQALSLEEDLDTLSNIATHAIETCRRLAHGFSPLSEVHGGLIHALKQLTVRPAGWHGPRLQFHCHQAAPLRLSPEWLEHVYRIAQEGITNAIKHSVAQAIDIRFYVNSDSIRLEIEDDGIGLPNYDPALGSGLRIMRYRAELLKAHLEIERRPAGGTKLLLRFDQPPSNPTS
jgi:PAS domain S-box-containing protein